MRRQHQYHFWGAVPRSAGCERQHHRGELEWERQENHRSAEAASDVEHFARGGFQKEEETQEEKERVAAVAEEEEEEDVPFDKREDNDFRDKEPPLPKSETLIAIVKSTRVAEPTWGGG